MNIKKRKMRNAISGIIKILI